MRIPGRLARAVARHRGDRWNRGVAQLCRTYLNAFDNLDYDARTNGEDALLDRLPCPAGSVLFDVGANRGSWTAAVRARHPGADVHAFELDPEVAAVLAGRFAADPSVTVVGAGLSDHDGVAALHRDGRSTRATSLVGPGPAAGDAGPGATIEVAVRTGDRYLAGAGIERVRFVKVDAEGADLAVLRGFAGALADRRIDALQFEHNECAVTAGVHLRRFVELLDPLGYDVGRLFPTGVLFRPWRPTQEREAAGNHVAVRRDLPELRAALAGSFA